MSTLLASAPPSSLDYKTQIFPKLTSAQIERVRPWAKLRQVVPGEILFKPGDEHVPFYVLLSGSLEIVQPTQPTQPVIATHVAGRFHR